MTACPQRPVERMAQNSILQCQNTDRSRCRIAILCRRRRVELGRQPTPRARELGWIVRRGFGRRPLHDVGRERMVAFGFPEPWPLPGRIFDGDRPSVR